MTIRAIETTYNGYRFRSRLEARWAVFMDTLGVPYRYEPEGFDLDGEWYLPDFWLPDQDCWLEIKPSDPSPRETELLGRLVQATGKDGYLLYGDCWVPGFDGRGYRGSKQWPMGDGADEEGVCWDGDSYCWCACPQCGRVGIEFEARAERLCSCFPGDKGYAWGADRLVVAYTRARSARFEHGAAP